MLRRLAPRPDGFVATLLLVAAALFLLQSGTVPHTHAGVGAGLYNQDHDLALLAALHGAATLDASPTAPVVVVSVAPAPLHTAAPPESAVARAADSRAPPRA